MGGWKTYIIYSGVQMERYIMYSRGQGILEHACIPSTQEMDAGGT